MTGLFGSRPKPPQSKPAAPAAAPPAPPGLGVGAAAQRGSDIVDVRNRAEFETEVMQGSLERLVLVDFWAPWCGPCKQLTPTLEKVIRDQRGKAKLVKINVDEVKDIAQAFRIQSIPTVYIFFGGQPVDAFQGAQPESTIRQLVEGYIRQLGSAAAGADQIEQALAEAEALLADGDTRSAALLFGRILEAEPESGAAHAGLARVHIATGDIETARAVLAKAPAKLANDPAIAGVRATLDLAAKAQSAGRPADLAARVATDPNDHEARFNLALAQFAGGDRAGAIDHLIELVRRDRGWNEEAARKQLLEFFTAMGPTDRLTVTGRRRLSALLFA